MLLTGRPKGSTNNGVGAQSYSGSAVSGAGDINSDGFDDILIGAADASPSGFASGEAYLVFGKAGGYNSSLDLSSLDGNVGFTIFGKNAEHQLGAALSNAGDVNGDGVHDVIIGAEGAGTNGLASGESYVILDIDGCLANAGFISTGTAITDFNICEGTDLLNDTQASVDFIPDYGDLNGFDPGIGFEYAVLLVDENNSIIDIDFNLPYDFDFSTLPTGTYSIYGFSMKEPNTITINNYLTTIQADGISDDLSQIREDDNDYSSGGAGNGSYCLDLKTPDVSGATLQIIIHPNPTISTNDINICAGSQLMLNVSSPDMELTYNWTGPEAFSSTDQNPVVTASVQESNNGIYTVSVTDIYSCTNMAMVTIIVDDPMFAGTPEPVIEVCAGEIINLEANTVEIVTVNSLNELETVYEDWKINTLAYYPKLVFPLNVTLTADSSTLMLNSEEELYTQLDNCSIDGTGCFTIIYPVDVVLLNEAGIIDYSWTGPNSFISSEQNPAIDNSLGSDGGIYTITTSSPGGCTATASTTVIINQLPVVTTPDITVSVGEEIRLVTLEPECFEQEGIDCPDYQWYGPNDFSAFGQNLLLTAGTSLPDNGTYTVYITDENFCVGSSDIVVTVNPDNCDSQALNVEAVDIIVTENEPLQLSASFTGGVSYEWSGPNNFISTEQNPIVTSSVSLSHGGEYIVTISDENNCTATDTMLVTVKLFVFNCANSELTAEASDFSVGEGATIQLIATSNIGVSYQWSGPNNFFSIEQNPIVTTNATATDAGNYLLEITDGNNCTASDIAVIMVDPDCVTDVIVSDNPASNAFVVAQNSITTDGPVIITDNNDVTFQAGQIINLMPGFEVTLGSDFLATIADCGINNSSAFTEGQDKLSENEISFMKNAAVNNSQFGLQVYSDDFNNRTRVVYKLLKTEILSLSIHDIKGEKIRDLIVETPVLPGDYSIDVENEFLTDGLYILVFKTENKIQTKKLVVLK